jgi:hypothetical protein
MERADIVLIYPQAPRKGRQSIMRPLCRELALLRPGRSNAHRRHRLECRFAPCFHGFAYHVSVRRSG